MSDDDVHLGQPVPSKKKKSDDDNSFADWVLIISLIFLGLIVLFVLCAIGFSLFLFAKQKQDNKELERLSVKAK